MLWIDFNVKPLLVHRWQKVHQQKFLFHRNWIIDDTDDWTNDSQDFLVNDFSFSRSHQKLHHLQSLFHSFAVSISNTLDKNLNVVWCCFFFVPYDCYVSGNGIIFHWDDHLLDVQRSFLLFWIWNQNFKYLVDALVDLILFGEQ